MQVEYADAERFLDWLLRGAISAARGDQLGELSVAPSGRFWLGRLAPEEKVQKSRLGERAERLEPCEAGMRLRPQNCDGRMLHCRALMKAWVCAEQSDDPDAIKWRKTTAIDVPVDVRMPTEVGVRNTAGREDIAAALTQVGADGLVAEIAAEIEPGKDGPELVVTVVNVSPEQIDGLDTNLYEVALEVHVGPHLPFLLESLPASFRYDRRVWGYGVNGGIRPLGPEAFATTDFAVFDKRRPKYWDDDQLGAPLNLNFGCLADDPVGPTTQLLDFLAGWMKKMWDEDELRRRAREENWDQQTIDFAGREAESARRELARIQAGVELLQRDATLRRSFGLANRSFLRAHTIGTIRHDAWRPFQLGYVLANLLALPMDSRAAEQPYVDTLFFTTGGGKTETYLLFTLTAAFYDRLTGKSDGITSWGRFPLRMLSLQQTQRFADVFAAAELVRTDEHINGSPFAVGFLVGEAGTPNRIDPQPRPGGVDPHDPTTFARYRILIHCPFCASEDVVLRFDHDRWALDHVCTAVACPWRDKPLPFRIVDEEIFRWLPTVVVGTLDKAANMAFQAAMRGFYGPPLGRCSVPEHGFTYAPRSRSPSGCLYPGCHATVRPLNQDPRMFAPSIRMQDELHLLRDSLGSVDAHYEALLDDFQTRFSWPAKIIASSATLAGHDGQIEALYRRQGRIFPVGGPRANRSFWLMDSEALGRRYVGVAPRGVTLEYANDQLVDSLQRAVRRALTEPDLVAQEAGVPREALPGLANLYGVDVVYGSTLKDVEAAARSFEAESRIQPMNSASLTGRTPLEDVRSVVARLTSPEADFNDRIHLIAASSMLSHGVDIDRLNIMIMLGLPLSTAEFIQTSSRIGRLFPGLVFAFHKIGRERDAAVFRIFPSFVKHMERLIEPVPITRKSRRILELTFPGLEQARIYAVHEPLALHNGLKQLTTPSRVRQAFTRMHITENDELHEIINMLGFTGPLDENLRADLTEYVRDFFRALNDPASNADWVSDLIGRPMMSLRDVEEQVPVYSRGGGS